MRLVALLALLCCGLPAQDADFKIDVQLVRLLVTVKNPAGDLIGSLDKRDFQDFDMDNFEQRMAARKERDQQREGRAIAADCSRETQFRYVMSEDAVDVVELSACYGFLRLHYLHILADAR